MIAVKNYYFTRLMCLVALLFLVLIEILPIPFTALTSIYILLFRPYWFKKLVDRVYSSKPVFELPPIFKKLKTK